MNTLPPSDAWTSKSGAGSPGFSAASAGVAKTEARIASKVIRRSMVTSLRGSTLRVPGLHAWMVADGLVYRDEFGVAGEYCRGNVVDLAADEPAHRHVKFQIHDV